MLDIEKINTTLREVVAHVTELSVATFDRDDELHQMCIALLNKIKNGVTLLRLDVFELNSIGSVDITDTGRVFEEIAEDYRRIFDLFIERREKY